MHLVFIFSTTPLKFFLAIMSKDGTRKSGRTIGTGPTRDCYSQMTVDMGNINVVVSF